MQTINQSNPWVSFCMSTFKRPEFLKKTLHSIQAQTFHDFEVIVSDNDIEQSAKKIVAELNDNRFKYYCNDENLGMIKSFNASIDRAVGEFIVMIADDDPVYNLMLETLFSLQNKHPGFGIYLGGCDWVCNNHELGKLYNLKVGTNTCLSNSKNIGEVSILKPFDFLDNLFKLKIFPHFLWSTAIVRKEVLVRMSKVPDYGTPFLGDYAFLAIMSSINGCVIINQSLGYQTLHKENFGRNQNEQILIVANNFSSYIKDKIQGFVNWSIIEPLLNKFLAHWLISHLTFLFDYSKKTKQELDTLAEIENKILKLPLMKNYRVKYYLKKEIPLLHNFIVKIKSQFV